MREATEAGIHIQTYSDTQVLAAERSKELDFYTKKTGMPCRITGNLNSMLYEEPPKMLLIDLEHKERLEAFQQAHAEWAVSYTHLDVYKRQCIPCFTPGRLWK